MTEVVVRVWGPSKTGSRSRLTGRITRHTFRGNQQLIDLETEFGPRRFFLFSPAALAAWYSVDPPLEVGDRVWVEAKHGVWLVSPLQRGGKP